MNWETIDKIRDDKESVMKLVFKKDTAVAEAVLYRYPTYEERTVICCSTQSGCPIGCRFCGAGDYFVTSLTTEEIVDQVSVCIEETGINPSDMNRLQIMFMSMGEPLLNTKALVPALRILHEKYPNAGLLISTSAPSNELGWFDIFQISKEIDTIGLQFSVHESTDEARNELIPFKNKLDLQCIADMGTVWFEQVGRKPFFNYCVHDNNNNTKDDVNRLYRLFNPSVFEATLSVICERNEGLPATNEHQRKLAQDFSDLMLEAGYNVRVFDPAGQDTIGGGCGQLWFIQEWMKNNPNKARPSVGCGKPSIHTPVQITRK